MPIGTADVTGTDRDDVAFRATAPARRRTSGDLTATANGTLFKLPAGNAGATFQVGASTVISTAASRAAWASRLQARSAGRRARPSVNLDLPISRRNRDFSALGNLTLNANAEIDQLSDFGTLTTIGAGANWSPVDRLNLITSWTREEGAADHPAARRPDPRYTRTRGSSTSPPDETALVTATTGGNPDLSVRPPQRVQARRQLAAVRRSSICGCAPITSTRRIEHPISSIIVTAGDRGRLPRALRRARTAVRGQLVSVDLRPVNFDRRERDTLRVGFDFSKPLKSRRPSQSVIDQMRAQFAPRRGGPGGAARRHVRRAGPGAARRRKGRRPKAVAAAAAWLRRSRRRRWRRRLRRRQPRPADLLAHRHHHLRRQGDDRSGLPELDYLHGDAAGSSGGTPRHQVEAQRRLFQQRPRRPARRQLAQRHARSTA